MREKQTAHKQTNKRESQSAWLWSGYGAGRDAQLNVIEVHLGPISSQFDAEESGGNTGTRFARKSDVGECACHDRRVGAALRTGTQNVRAIQQIQRIIDTGNDVVAAANLHRQGVRCVRQHRYSQRLRDAATVDISDDVAIRQGEAEEGTGLELSRRRVTVIDGGNATDCPSQHWVASIVRAARPAHGRERIRRINLLKRRVLYCNSVAPSSSCQDA